MQLTLDKLRGPNADAAAAIAAADVQFGIGHAAGGDSAAQLEQLGGCAHALLLAEAEQRRYTRLLQQLHSIRELPPKDEVTAMLDMLDFYATEAAEINNIAQAICDELGALPRSSILQPVLACLIHLLPHFHMQSHKPGVPPHTHTADVLSSC